MIATKNKILEMCGYATYDGFVKKTFIRNNSNFERFSFNIIFFKLTNRFSEWLALHTNEIGLKFYNEKSMSEPPLWMDTWSNVKIEKEGFSINPLGQ